MSFRIKVVKKVEMSVADAAVLEQLHDVIYANLEPNRRESLHRKVQTLLVDFARDLESVRTTTEYDVIVSIPLTRHYDKLARELGVYDLLVNSIEAHGHLVMDDDLKVLEKALHEITNYPGQFANFMNARVSLDAFRENLVDIVGAVKGVFATEEDVYLKTVFLK